MASASRSWRGGGGGAWAPPAEADAVGAPDDGDRRAGRLEGGFVGRTVDPERETRHDCRVHRRQRPGDPARRRAASRRRSSRSDDGDRLLPTQRADVATDEQDVRWQLDETEPTGIGRLLDRHDPESTSTDIIDQPTPVLG